MDRKSFGGHRYWVIGNRLKKKVRSKLRNRFRLLTSFRITLDNPPFRPFFSKTRGGGLSIDFFLYYYYCFCFTPEKMLEVLKHQEGKRKLPFFFFVSVIQQKKKVYLYSTCFFFGANTSQICGKLLKHQEVKTKTSVFFSFCHSCKTKTFHSSCLLKLLKHLSCFESK